MEKYLNPINHKVNGYTLLLGFLNLTILYLIALMNLYQYSTDKDFLCLLINVGLYLEKDL
jgi:hypothetical protein